ncbi:type II toxin-antitoxin system VapC family toxin [Thalassospira sp. MCCC 1A03138]|uniref:type II toxin-antitoxin system VapC family toxin n=1 Tax=Thalassospira sp. MCCC 1A03138 TaxID=1470576 RepID=UPI00111C252C|nr:type II toxin-antitoxin system VapC family toxin [Thalassospira sp. MCCC 1A03138]
MSKNMEKINKYLLDTNFFNHVLDDLTNLDHFTNHKLFVTHIQLDEIKQTSCVDRREQLLSRFQTIDAESIPTNAAVWGVSNWNEAKWGDANGLYEKLLSRIQNLDKASGKKKRPENQSRDALIAATAISENFVLITNDHNLTIAAEEFHCTVIDPKNIE